VALVVVVGVALVVAPANEERVVALAQPPAWRLTVTFRSGEQLARVALRMDSMSRWEDVRYQVDSTEQWAPHWQGQIQGSLSEIVEFDDGWRNTPGRMDKERAMRLARSFRVTLTGDEGTQVIEFKDAGFAEPAPVLDQLWFRLAALRSRVVN
jgi:hypothetical protein